MYEGHRRHLLPPDPLDDRETALDARVRMKLRRGQRLDTEEQTFLADLPGVHEISAEEVREAAALHGGVDPIDAATGERHVAHRPD